MARKSMSEVTELSGKELLGVGSHHVKITKVVEGETTTGKPKVDITFENEVGIAWDRLILTEKALGFAKRILSACGYDVDSLEYDVAERGKQKGNVTQFFYDGDEVDLEDLLVDEEVMITLKESEKTYKDPVTGETKTKDKVTYDVTNIEEVE
jgi:hypothetical protein